MCDCENMQSSIDKLNVTLAGLNQRVSGWADSLQMGAGNDWEYSLPLFVGGVAGVYALRSPFMGSSQWKIESASAGATASQVIVSPFRSGASGIDLTGASQSYSDVSPFVGSVLLVPASTTVQGPRGWYDVTNSEQAVYVTITCATNAAYATIQFRQKRVRR